LYTGCRVYNEILGQQGPFIYRIIILIRNVSKHTSSAMMRNTTDQTNLRREDEGALRRDLWIPRSLWRAAL